MIRTTRLQLTPLGDRVLPSFSTAATYAVGSNPQAVATADFNNDGNLDLAATGYSRVSVRLGDGAGGFDAAREFNTEWWELSSIAVADFNNDARPDLVVGHLNGFSILMGNGDGTFQPSVTTLVGSWGMSSVAAGNFTGDGNIDLAASYYDADFNHDYRFFEGNGQGGFADPVSSSRMPGEGKLVPFNGWLATTDGTVLGYSELGQQPPVPGGQAGAAGDFSGDGLTDLIVAGSNLLEVLPGRSEGGLHAPIHHAANGSVHTAVATADFNADGNLDAVVANGDVGTVSVMLGTGDGTLGYAGAFATGTSPSGLAVGDFNGDGRPDVAVTNAGSNDVAVLLNDGDWTVVPVPSTLFISDATVTEGHTGTRAATFTVNLSIASDQPITIAYATANRTAAAATDYQAASGTLTFAPGETTTTITVQVNGDRLGEADETFEVNLSNPMNVVIADAQALGTIFDDEPRISIGDVTRLEGRKGQTTLFTFTVTLTVPDSILGYDQPVTMSFRTANGIATTSNGDYVAKSGTLTFAPGETTKTITIEVKGDNKREANETFFLDLSGLSPNGLFTQSRGTGTILNDD